MQNTTPEQEFARRLKLVLHVRSYRNIAEAAQICGLAKPTLETYLAGGCLPSALKLKKICEGWGVCANWLLFGEGFEGDRFIEARIAPKAVGVAAKACRQYPTGAGL